MGQHLFSSVLWRLNLFCENCFQERLEQCCHLVMTTNLFHFVQQELRAKLEEEEKNMTEEQIKERRAKEAEEKKKKDEELKKKREEEEQKKKEVRFDE